MTPDYYLLDELLTDEAREVRDRVRSFVESDVLPVINDYWDRAEFPWAKLAEMLAEITAMQLCCFRMAQLQEQGRWTAPMASLAKLNHARKARQICRDARDILGGNGLLLENHVARHLTGMEPPGPTLASPTRLPAR